jgi:hypothetical protein
MKKITTILFAGLAAMAFTACGDEENALPPVVNSNFVTSITLSKNEIVLDDIGATGAIQVTAAPANAEDAGIYEFLSENTQVFTVDRNGLVTATGQGSAILSVVAKNNANAKARCVVRVVGKLVETVTISPVYKYRTVTLTNAAAPAFELMQQTTVTPADAYNRQLKYISLNPEVAIVNENGRVTPLWEGLGRIVAEATDGSGVSDTCYLAVSITPVATLTFHAGTFNNLNLNTKMNQASNYDISSANYGKGTGTGSSSAIRYYPTNATRNILEYASSDEEILEIQSTSTNGFRLIPKKMGRTTITASATDGHGATVTSSPINVHGIYPRANWRIVDASPTGEVQDEGDTWGGTIDNFFVDGKQVGFYRMGTDERPIIDGDPYFTIDFGEILPFNYLIYSHSWSNHWNNFSRANRQTLYGSNDGTNFTQIGLQLTLNPAYNAFYTFPEVQAYRYLKVALATSNLAYLGAIGDTYSWTRAKLFIVYDFNLGYLPPL